jgi:uncharacterized protein (DUF2141 family)
LTAAFTAIQNTRVAPALPFGLGPRGNRRPTLPTKISSVCAAAILLLASILLGQAPPAPTNVIHAEIGGLRNGKGQVLCALYASPLGFPKEGEKAKAHAQSAITGGHAVCEFSGIDAGTYAVAVFHDENGNGKLDTNFLGIPREGVGASNDAKGHMGPPKFAAAAFHFAGGRLELKITMTYL